MKFWILIITILLMLAPTAARAEGPLTGGTRIYIEREPVGPFTVTSFAAPNPPVNTDDLWVTVQVRDGAKAITDAEVWVAVTPRDGGEPRRALAVHELAPTPLDYTAFLDVSTPGTYDVLLEVVHPSGGGQVNYTVNVSEPLTRYIVLILGGPFLLVALLLARRFGRAAATEDKLVKEALR
jgi:hypothetical protein